MTEFELIRSYFVQQNVSRPDVRIGIGDDAAYLRAPADIETVVTSDVLVSGVHFFDDVDPEALGHKSLAVNLSDLAAAGAEPAWFLLNLTLPNVDARWLERFAAGMFALAKANNVQLVGGDTTRGPLSIGITAIGFVPQGKGMLRSGARVGDAVYVTGALGDAALALASKRGTIRLSAKENEQVTQRLERPMPRLAEGLALRDVASSAIDISDGLLADLSHVLHASGIGARIELASVPLSVIYRAHLADVGFEHALAGGDDYELCFTVPPANLPALNALAAAQHFTFTRIGEITAGSALEIRDAAGNNYQPSRKGYEHFAAKE